MQCVHNIITMVIAKCGHPMMNSSVKVVDYGDNDLSADIGTIVNLTCLPDLSLVGPNSIACTGNGEWQPDPSGVMRIKGNELT